MKQGASTRVGPAPPGRRKEHALAATVLMLLLNVMFFPYVWGDLDLMTGANDSPSVTSLGGPNGDPHHPVNQMHWKMLDANGSGTLDEPTFPLVHHEIFHDGDVPLWNPDAAFGTPLAAAMQQQPFYPLTAVVMLAPGPSNFAFYIILRLFVAGFATYLFLRFFIGFLPALGGAIAFMLNGYFIKYLTMPHLSVETLTGALFLGVEYVLLRRRPWFAVPFLAVVVWFDFLGGMPESSFINIVFATMYAAFRIATVRAYRTGWLARCREIVLALGCGFACAAFLILPFAELVVQSFNIHEPSKNGGNFAALVADTSPRTSLAIYALPMLFGPPWEAVGLALNDGYFGVVIIFCGIAAVAYAALVPKSGLAVPVIFFATAVGLLTAKRYGLPWINWVGALPIVRVIALTKYQEAATAFAVAALVGFGLHALVGDARRRPAIAATAFALTLAVLQKSYDVTAHLTSPAQVHARAYFYLAFASGLLALVAVGALAALAARGPSARDRILGGCALLALCVEMSLNYFVPMYYFVDPGPSKRQNPYLGAPYIDFVHANTTDGARVYAEKKAWLEPDWPQAFDLKDIRNIDAIYVDRYLPFCRAFIPKENKTDLLEEFSGAGDYTMASPAGRKLLSLGSVRYVVAGDMLDPSTLGARIQAYVAAHEAGSDRSPSGQFQLGSEWLDGFAQARAAQDVTMPLDVAPGAQFIALALGTPDDLATHAGRTVDFFVRVADARGRTRVALLRRIQSARTPHGWERHEIDLRRYAGTRVRLTFGVRTNDPAQDTLGYWGAIREERVAREPDPFALVRHYGGINVFAFAHPLPHGALYEHVTVADDRKTLDALTQPDFDVMRSAIVARESVPPSLAPGISALSRALPAPARRAILQTYTATRVAYATDEPKPTMLFLSDTFYPGWKAFVDNRETPIVRTNYLFRGVVLAPGKHAVEFRYEPLPFRAGLALCILALGTLLVFGVVSRRASLATD